MTGSWKTTPISSVSMVKEIGERTHVLLLLMNMLELEFHCL